MKVAIAVSLGIVEFCCGLAFAAFQSPPLRYTLLYNYDLRHTEENFYSNRLEALFSKALNSGQGYQVKFKAKPFVELRHSPQRRKMERLSTGVELGLDWADLLYMAEQFRQVWRSEPVYNRGVIKNTDMPEAVSIITLSSWLIPNKKILKGYISGEYTYDFRLGRGARIESIAGLLIPVDKSLEVNMNWRHRDRIHSDDCDTFEASASYLF